MTVYPGDFIATAEECVSGSGTNEEGGRVFASAVGKLAEDKLNSRVESPVLKRRIQKDDLIYGLVQDVYGQVALVEFQPENPNASAHNKFAYLRISEVQRGYTESFAGYVGVGDYIRARIVEVTPLGIYLTIAAPELGIIRTFCSRCRHEVSKGICGYCGNKEIRKTARRGV